MKSGKYWFHLQKKMLANFHVFGLFIPKKRVKSEKKIPSFTGVSGIARGFWTKFDAQLAQPC
jgi:hypothetical protein